MGTEVDTVSLDNSVDPIAYCSVQCAVHTQPCTTVQTALQYSSVQCAVQCIIQFLKVMYLTLTL